MASHSVLIVNANPLLNLVLPAAMVVGTIQRVPELLVHAEGKGVNVARVLTRLGHSVCVTGFAGGHSGAWLQDLLSQEGIESRMIATAAPMRMGFMATPAEASHPTSILPHGFEVTAKESDALIDATGRLLDQNPTLIIISGGLPDASLKTLYPELLSLAERHGIPAWLDAHGPGLQEVLQGPTLPKLAKPNEEEWAECGDWPRVPELHITRGDAPTTVMIEGQPVFDVIPPPVTQINPIGCGDCYLAGLAHGLLNGWSLEDRCRFASAAGAANARRQDVAAIQETEVWALIEGVTFGPSEHRGFTSMGLEDT